METGAMMILFSLLFGLVFGSFLNVCIYRIPLKKSIIFPPSSCPNCGHHIKFYDNIPVLSYLLLRAKCRYCHARIPLHYPVVELLTGLLSMALFIRYGVTYQYILSFLFIIALVMISFIDLHHQIIPDILSIPGIFAGIAVSFIPGRVVWLDSLIGAVGGGGILYLIALVYKKVTGRDGMGGGDVKLLAMIGAWMGWRALPFIVLLSSLSGIVIGGSALMMAGKGYRVRIPFGPFLSLGTIIYFFFGRQILAWYYHLFLV
ncbi:MAG: prepilin peptidase [Deltaproteobacteria bacterium]|nr:prepilin peptidase [Deltaproteobacteria bacterium]